MELLEVTKLDGTKIIVDEVEAQEMRNDNTIIINTPPHDNSVMTVTDYYGSDYGN